MKSKLWILGGLGSVALVVGLMSLFFMHGSRCNDIDAAAPSTPWNVVAGHTYTFKTYNSTSRKLIVVLARKDASGRLAGLECSTVNQGDCDTTLVWTARTNETLYVTYKYRHWSALWYNTIDNVYTANNVNSCGEEPVDSNIRALILRKGIVADAGGSGTATTTVDDK